MAYRIVSFDGGGVRGVYTAVLLKRLLEGAPQLLKSTQLFAGTSTGGIVALGLAAGLAPLQLVNLYRDHIPEIFDDSWLDDLKDLGGVSGAEYDNKKLKKVLQKYFGNLRLKNLHRKVIIPTFDLDNESKNPKTRTWKPKFFHNFEGADSDGNELVVDIALRTSAAPSFFPVYQGYIDGGVIANNPSMAALAQALDASTGKQQLKDVYLLSLSTGLTHHYIQGADHDWGLAQWAKPLVNIMIDGGMGVADYQCERLLGKRYCRLAPDLPKPVDLDDADSVIDLIRFAQGVNLKPTLDWVQRTFLAAV